MPRHSGWRVDAETLALRKAIGLRLAKVARDRHGRQPGAAMARELGVSSRTWCYWTVGTAMPGESLLRFVELTGVRPEWLLRGDGPRYRRPVSALPRAERALVRALEDWIAARQVAIILPPEAHSDGPRAALG